MYDATSEVGSPAEQIGTVPCNIAEIQDQARATWHGPWPDGSSTIAKVGTPIHAQAGTDPACALTLKIDDKWVLFLNKKC